MNILEQFDPAASSARPLLRPADTCWQIPTAGRVGFVVDGAAYFRAAKAAMKKARQSIFLMAWDFHAKTRLEPDRPESGPDEIGAFLNHLAAQNPHLRIRVLKWGMPLMMALPLPRVPLPILQQFNHDRVEYRIDRQHPTGASHHQKILVVDDAVAFCGGADFCVDRWDTSDHRDNNASRHKFPARHDIMMVVDGAAARALGALARKRWQTATGERLEPTRVDNDPWPDCVKGKAGPIGIGVARTLPSLKGKREIREIERLCLAMIGGAQHSLYIETQYFACPIICEALMKRLREPRGPEIVLICSARAPSYFDHLAMDPVRNALLGQLRVADRYGRFRAFSPMTAGGAPIIIHSKVVIADNTALRIGSSNMNNRSMGFDTECDVCITTDDLSQASRAANIITGFRYRLLAEHLATTEETVAAEEGRTGSLVKTIEALNPQKGRRLAAVDETKVSILDSLFTSLQLLDPFSCDDSWRPWRRARALSWSS
jgi:phosphatidylserine/phosphatidylglycerophosphate/cardiolipin synthase-like enzyme